jgi:hypothetical protein
MFAKSPSRARLLPIAAAVVGATLGGALVPAQASSHREAPTITLFPKVDGTDLYMFNSYEPGTFNGRPRSEFVTIISNYIPLQAPYGGPNYFSMDPRALYEIHIDNNGDNREDITFQFRFQNKLANKGNGVALDIGPTGNTKSVAIPLIQAGQVTGPASAALNLNETFTVDLVRGDRRKGSKQPITNATGGSATFDKPVDNIGNKTIPDYAGYADKHIYTVNIPGCSQQGRVFVGQRKEGFAVNLGTVFDLVNAPVGVIADPANIGAVANTIDDANITSLALEVHKSCLTQGNDPVIGAWMTASLRQGALKDPTPRKGHQTTEISGGAWVQMSRLANPLVNELVIGLPDKDRFNGSKPKDDLQFLDYVTNPTLPKLLEIAFDMDPAFGGVKGGAVGKIEPKNFPRTDLATVFLTGIAGVNRPAAGGGSEMMRLNTNTPVTLLENQKRLGVLGGDLAGYPNGRRPKDDVVDISLVAVAGGLCVANGGKKADGSYDDKNALGLNNVLGLSSKCNGTSVPLGDTSLNLHDAVDNFVIPTLNRFPYLFTPTPGAGPGSN